MYIRTVNSFLSWLHEEGQTGTHLRVKLLPDPKKPVIGISDREAKLLLASYESARMVARHRGKAHLWSTQLALQTRFSWQ
jgi:hypothetical protein